MGAKPYLILIILSRKKEAAKKTFTYPFYTCFFILLDNLPATVRAYFRTE